MRRWRRSQTPWQRRRLHWWQRRAPRWLERAVIALAVVVGIGITQQLLTSPTPAGLAASAQAENSVRVRVVDGDTIQIRGTGERVRLANIDTPETHERARCETERDAGERATSEARRIFSGAQDISIRRTGRIDRYGRTIAFVFVDGRDFGEIMISAGLARPWRGRREPWCGPNDELLR